MCSLRERTPLLTATSQQTDQHPQSLPRGGGDRLTQIDSTEETQARNRTTRRLVQTTLLGETAEVRCMFMWQNLQKNIRGLKIHQSRSKCGRKGVQTQRTDDKSDETQKDPSQDSTHSTEDLSVFSTPYNSTSRLTEATNPQPSVW
jgi:hypothetical protein